MIKRVMMLWMLICPVYVCGMDEQITQRVWPIDPQVAERHKNIPEWHNQLLIAVTHKQKEVLSNLLREAGDDAVKLVSSHRSMYGTILEAAYVESSSEPSIIEKVLEYMSIESLVDCFYRKKRKLYEVWAYNQERGKDLQSSPCAEAIVRDLHLKDPNRFLLTLEERQKLDIK